MLLRAGVVTSDDIQKALALQAGGAEWRLGRILVRMGALDDLTLAQTLAKQFHTEIVDLRRTPPTAATLARLPREAALQLQALPILSDDESLTIAVSDPPTRELRVALQRSADSAIRLVLCPADELAAALEYWYADEYEYECEVIVDEASGLPPHADGASQPQPSEADREPDHRRNDQLIEWLLREADRQGATAIHLDHGAAGLSVRYRIGADLVPGPHLPSASGTTVCDRLRAAAALDDSPAVAEGEFDVVVSGRPLTCRVTTLTTAAGSHMVVRIRAKNPGHHVGEVGIHGKAAIDVRRVLAGGRGVIIVGGTDRGAREAVCRSLIDEIGTAERVVVVLHADSELEIPGAIGIPLESSTSAGIHAATMLSADAIVVDGVTGVDSSRSALDASSNVLVILTVLKDDPVQIASNLVDDVGAFLVAGTVLAILIAGTDGAAASTSVHVVTDDVCKTILDIEEPR